VVASLLVAIALAGAAPAAAQSTGDGSFYSRYGVGLLEGFSSSQSQALGGGGYALRSLNYNPSENPALWADQVFTRFQAGASYRTINASAQGGASGQASFGQIEALHFSFPIYKETLGFGLSFQPYSRSNFEAVDRGVVGPDSLSYSRRFQGVGGLQQLRAGLGYTVADYLRVGASADVLFGIVEEQRRTTSPQFRDAVLTDGTRLWGVTGTVGAHLALADVFTDDALSVGASVTLPATLQGERIRTLDEGLSRDTLSSRRGDVGLPWTGRLGVAYQPGERWSFVLDGLYAPWSTLSSDFDRRAQGESAVTRFPIGGTESMADRWRISGGVEWVPGGEDQLATFFERIAYRLGGYYERLYIAPDGADLNAVAATGGLSLPTSLSGTRIDLNSTVGVRGSRTSLPIRDVYYGFSLHVSFGERWFQERKLR
jgi:hypothetical protein